MRGLSVRATASDSTSSPQRQVGTGREGPSLRFDILPAGLVIDEPQSPWETEMARLMNEAFLLPPRPAPTPRPARPTSPSHPSLAAPPQGKPP